MKIVQLLLVLLCLLMPVFRLAYCQPLEDDPYYEQFKDKHFEEAKKSSLLNFFYVVFSGLIIWFAYYFISGRNDAGGIKVFYASIFLAIVMPLFFFSLQVWSLKAKENPTPFSRNPSAILKNYPLKYGMTKEEIRRKWGDPREITGRYDEEIWFYSRLEPRIDFRFGGQYIFYHVKGWRQINQVSLIFRTGLLVDWRLNR